MTLIKNLIFATPCLAILTACNGNSDGGGTSNTQFTLSRVQVVSEINRPTKVLSYDASQAGEQYSGYMVTNDASELTGGVYDALFSDDVEVTYTRNRSSSSFIGNVIVEGQEYLTYVMEIGDNEVLMAVPPEYDSTEWSYGVDVAFPDNAVIRTVGPEASPVSISGNATYRGKLLVVGGGGTSNHGATLDVNFDTASATFTSSSRSSSAPRVYAEVDLDINDGSFSSDDLVVSFSRSISTPQTVTGNLQGNFTGSDHGGAIGTISSDAGQDQFKGAFALSK